jgi:hypothetical protein
MKSENLNFLEPSGSPQACNGTALPLPMYEYILEETLEMLATTVQAELNATLLMNSLLRYSHFLWSTTERNTLYLLFIYYLM